MIPEFVFHRYMKTLLYAGIGSACPKLIKKVSVPVTFFSTTKYFLFLKAIKQKLTRHFLFSLKIFQNQSCSLHYRDVSSVGQHTVFMLRQRRQSDAEIQEFLLGSHVLWVELYAQKNKLKPNHLYLYYLMQKQDPCGHNTVKMRAL